MRKASDTRYGRQRNTRCGTARQQSPVQPSRHRGGSIDRPTSRYTATGKRHQSNWHETLQRDGTGREWVECHPRGGRME